MRGDEGNSIMISATKDNSNKSGDTGITEEVWTREVNSVNDNASTGGSHWNWEANMRGDPNEEDISGVDRLFENVLTMSYMGETLKPIYTITGLLESIIEQGEHVAECSGLATSSDTSSNSGTSSTSTDIDSEDSESNKQLLVRDTPVTHEVEEFLDIEGSMKHPFPGNPIEKIDLENKGASPITDYFISEAVDKDSPVVTMPIKHSRSEHFDSDCDLDDDTESNTTHGLIEAMIVYKHGCCNESHSNKIELSSRWASWGATLYAVPKEQLASASPDDISRFVLQCIKRYGTRAQDGALEAACLGKYVLRHDLCETEKIMYSIPTTNRFAVLDAIDMEDLSSVDSNELKELQDVFRASARVPGNVKPQKVVSNDAIKQEQYKKFGLIKKTEAPMKKDEKENRAKRKKIALRRIKERLSIAVSSYNVSSTAGVLLQNLITPLTEALMKRSDLESLNGISAYNSDLKHWLLYCLRFYLSKKQAHWGSLKFISPDCDFKILTDTRWVRCLAEDGDVETNPGPVNITMDDVCNCRDAFTYFDDGLLESIPAIELMLSKIIDRRDKGGMPGREADIVLHQRWSLEDRESLRHENIPLPLAETTMYPNHMIMPNGQLMRRQTGAPILFFTGDNCYQGAVWATSKYLVTQAEAYATRWPFNSTSPLNLFGHNPADTIAIAQNLEISRPFLANGDEWAMKLGLIRTWTDYRPARGTRFIPIRGQERELARWQVLDANSAILRTYNRSPRVVENCGGYVNNVIRPNGFPFQGVGAASPGTFSLHLALNQIDRSRAIIVLPRDWQIVPNANRLLALWMTLVAPWPMCHFGLAMTCINGLGGANTRTNVNYSWFGSFLSLPGRLDINILIPRKLAAATTTVPVAGFRVAQEASTFHPTMGPTAVGLHPANMPLTVRGDDNGIPAVEPTFVEYLMSWVDSFTSDDVISLAKQFLQKGVFLPQHLQMAMETPAVLATRKGTLFARDPRKPFTPNVINQTNECEAAYTGLTGHPCLQSWTCAGDCVSCLNAVDDWAVTYYMGEFHGAIPRSNPFVMSCVMTTYVSMNRTSLEVGIFDSEHLVSAQLMLYRHVAIGWQLTYATLGLAWDALAGVAGGNHQFQVLSECVPKLIKTDMVEKMLKNVFGLQLTKGDIGMAITKMRCFPKNWTPAVCDNMYMMRYNLLTPTLYPDAYVHTSAIQLPKRFTPYIGRGAGVTGIVKSDYVPGAQPGTSGPMITPEIRGKIVVQPYDWPLFTDNEAWNSRVALTMMPNFDLLPVMAGGVHLPGAMPAGLVPTLATWAPGNLPGIPVAITCGAYGSTLWIPPVDYNTRYLVTIQVLPPDVDKGTRVQVGQSQGRWWTWGSL